MCSGWGSLDATALPLEYILKKDDRECGILMSIRQLRFVCSLTDVLPWHSRPATSLDVLLTAENMLNEFLEGIILPCTLAM